MMFLFCNIKLDSNMTNKTFFTQSFLSLFLLISVLLFNACSKETLSFSIHGADEAVTQFNQNRTAEYHADFLVAEVTIKEATNNRIAIFINNAELAAPYFYLLQTKASIEGINQNIDRAEVLFFENHLIINSLEEDLKYIFKLSNEPLTPLATQLDFDYSYSGFGLGKYKGYAIADEMNNSASTRFYGMIARPLPIGVACECLDADDWDDTPSPSCDAGGWGASSCSIEDDGESCSTSCGLGLYACCNDTE